MFSREQIKLYYEIHYNSYFCVLQSISIDMYKIHNLIRVISNCPTRRVPTFLRAEYSNLTICACLHFPQDLQHNQIREPDSHNVLVSDLQTRIQTVDKILHATRALAHLLTSLRTCNMIMKQKNAIIYFLWTRNQKSDIKGMSRKRQK